MALDSLFACTVVLSPIGFVALSISSPAFTISASCSWEFEICFLFFSSFCPHYFGNLTDGKVKEKSTQGRLRDELIALYHFKRLKDRKIKRRLPYHYREEQGRESSCSSCFK